MVVSTSSTRRMANNYNMMMVPVALLAVILATLVAASSSAQAQGIKGAQQLARPQQQQQQPQYSPRPQQQQQQQPRLQQPIATKSKRPVTIGNQQQVAPSSFYQTGSDQLARAPAPGGYGGQQQAARPQAQPQIQQQQQQPDQGYDSNDFGANSQSGSDSASSGYNQAGDSSGGQDSEADSEPALYGSVAGKPGVDFPAYTRIPKTSFTCEGKGFDFGYYADEETGCQAYHVCWSGRRESFLCGVGTVFNQAILACDYWHSVDCSKSSQFYGVNSELGKSSAEPASRELQQPRQQLAGSSAQSGQAGQNQGYGQSGFRMPASPVVIGQQQQQQQQQQGNYASRTPASTAATGGQGYQSGANANEAQQQQTYGRGSGKTSGQNFGAVFRPQPAQIPARQQPQQQQYGSRPQTVSAVTPRPFGQAQRSGGSYPARGGSPSYQQLSQFEDQQQQQQIDHHQQQQQQQVDQQQQSNSFDDTPVQTTTVQSPLMGVNQGARGYGNPGASSAITSQYDTMMSPGSGNGNFEQIDEQQQRQSDEGLRGARAAASNNRNWYIMRPIESH